MSTGKRQILYNLLSLALTSKVKLYKNYVDYVAFSLPVILQVKCTFFSMYPRPRMDVAETNERTGKKSSRLKSRQRQRVTSRPTGAGTEERATSARTAINIFQYILSINKYNSI